MEERKLKFTQLNITNFRNISELEIKFNDDITRISGKNGLGKTNILSAIMWCLFGKDIYDVKQFPISPIIDGKEDNNITTTVRLVINDNYVVERSYYERKATVKTGWIIDGKVELVALTQAKYNEELKEHFVDEETFKSLSNINYIPGLNWKDLKALIFSLIGNIEDIDVLLRDDFSLIEEYVKKFGIDETQRLLKDTDTELNNDIKKLETEYQTLLNTKDKYVVDTKESEELQKRKEELTSKLNDFMKQQELIKKHNNDLLEKQQEVNKVKQEIERLKNEISFCENQINDYTALYNNSGASEESLREKEKLDIESRIIAIEKQKSDNENILHDLENEIESLKEKGNTLKQQEVKIENDKCSSCGQTLPKEKLDEILENMKKEQITKLEDLKKQLDTKKESLESCKKLIEDQNGRINDLKQEIENLPNKKYEIETETEKQKEIRVRKEQQEIDKKEFEETLPKFEEELSKLNNELELLEKEEFIVDDTTEINNELNTINEKLATTITLNKINDDINEKQKELEEKRNNKVVNKDKLQQVIKFNNVKAELLKQKVRNYFDIVDFKTKEFNQDGTEVETFKICNEKGIEWKDINTGHKILLGIDLLQGIMKAKNIYVPIIVDNFECLTNEIKLNNTQLIVARAEKGKESLEIK